jgi:virulence-associated protein VapD
MFVNQIPFFITISRNIKFGTIEVLKNRKNPTILQAFKNVNAIYNNLGFQITMGQLAAEDIMGPNLSSLKGKTVWRGGTHVRTEYHGVPRGIMERHWDVTLCVDIMFVNQIPFFITICRNIKFGTIEVLKNRKNPTILQAFKNVNAIYNNLGFQITMGHTDNEFEPMRGDFLDLNVELNVASNDENVPEIKRYIRNAKERTQCVYNTVPFRQMPSRIVVEMVQWYMRACSGSTCSCQKTAYPTVSVHVNSLLV